MILAKGKLAADAALHSPELSVQLKSSARDVRCEQSPFPFDLPIKNYEDLTKRCLVPRILIVFFMPADQDEWLTHTEDELVLRRCAYWLSLRGGPATTNETEKRVHLPRENLVTQESLKQLLVRVSREEEF